jgi:hypothetical protein
MNALADVLGRTRLAPTGFLPMTKLFTATETSWERLEADHAYFCGVFKHLLAGAGYQVEKARVYQAPREEAARECGFVLQRAGRRWLGLALRQDLIVTSDVVGRLGEPCRALKPRPACSSSPASSAMARCRRREVFRSSSFTVTCCGSYLQSDDYSRGLASTRGPASRQVARVNPPARATSGQTSATGGEARRVDVQKQTPGRNRHVVGDTLGLLLMFVFIVPFCKTRPVAKGCSTAV